MLNGVLNIYKERGYTSHDVVAKLRGITHQKKIGHTGTLDPDAEGVLPVCLGKATRLCDLLTDKDKTYETVLLLGKETDTQDITGKVLSEKDTEGISEAEVRERIRSFEGEYDQIPPMYSALKVNGKKLYELARDGKEVPRKPRRVKIYRITILEVALPRVRMEVQCSKGTYIRTLCHDIGRKLGCGGCMEKLLRTQVGRFHLSESIRLEEAQTFFREGTLKEHMTAIDEMFPDYEQVYLKPGADAAVRNGNMFRADAILWTGSFKELHDKDKVRVYDENRNFIAVYVYREKERDFKIVRMFFDRIES